MIEDNDKTLVQRCLSGDSKAFEILLNKYQKPVFNVAYRIIHNFDDAEDITQTAFIKAYENLKKYNPNYKFFSWIFRIVTNEALNYLNKKNRTDTLYDNEEFEDESAANNFEEQETAKLIQDALMQIESKYRSLIVLYQFQNCSYSEISYILKVPEKTVKSRLFTARQLLKDVLIKNGILENE